MGRVEDRHTFDDRTRIALLESDMDETSGDVKDIKRILWTLVTSFMVSGGLFVIDLLVRSH